MKPKWPPNGLQIDMFQLHVCFFRDLLPDLLFPTVKFCQFLQQLSMNFGPFLASWVVYAPRGLKIASRLLQDGLLEPMWTRHGPKLAPSWFKLGPCWPQVGSNFVQVGSMLGPDPGPQPPLDPPKPFQIPSLLPLGLPNTYKTQSGVQKGLPGLQLGP